MIIYKKNNIIYIIVDTTDTTDTTNQAHLNGGCLVYERMDEPASKKTCTSWAYSSSIGKDFSPKKRMKLDKPMEKQNNPNGPLPHVLDVLDVLDVPAHYVQAVMMSTRYDVDYCEQVKQMEEDTKEDRNRVLKCLFQVGMANDLLALEIVRQAKMWYGKLTNHELADLIQLYKTVKSRQLARFPSTKKMIETCIRRPQRKTPLRHPYIL
jgi:hypothetical protein